MNKAIESNTESGRGRKGADHHVTHRLQKVLKHRHERRKVRACLRLGDWADDAWR